jgi:hypothetical protein
LLVNVKAKLPEDLEEALYQLKDAAQVSEEARSWSGLLLLRVK